MIKSTFTIENPAKFCSNCCDKLIKYGKTKNGNQRYKCKNCQKTSVEIYHYNAYISTINSNIIQLTKEGLGIRSTARYLKISTTTLLKRLLTIASKIIPPKITVEDHEFQVDELRTFHKKRLKPIWITYTFSLQNRKIHAFHVGYPIIQAKPTKIYTDKLNTYRLVIPSELHSTRFRSTNHIERNHLNLRTHLKRLTRKTICYTKNIAILSAILAIYFWS